MNIHPIIPIPTNYKQLVEPLSSSLVRFVVHSSKVNKPNQKCFIKGFNEFMAVYIYLCR